MSEKEQQFCDWCDVSMDLHPSAEDGDAWACDVAQKKADQLERFIRAFVR